MPGGATRRRGAGWPPAQGDPDQSFYWLEVHLKMQPGESHDLMKPVSLVTAAGREIEPADTTLGGDKRQGTTDLWFKFWLEPADIEQPLKLRINDGTLVIKSNRAPAARVPRTRIFNSPRWYRERPPQFDFPSPLPATHGLAPDRQLEYPHQIRAR
jgi:hypothetical protein